MLHYSLLTVYKAIYDNFIFITVFAMKLFHGTHPSVTELPMGSKSCKSYSFMLSHKAASLNTKGQMNYHSHSKQQVSR